jgi:hypothetical protein
LRTTRVGAELGFFKKKKKKKKKRKEKKKEKELMSLNGRCDCGVKCPCCSVHLEYP